MQSGNRPLLGGVGCQAAGSDSLKGLCGKQGHPSSTPELFIDLAKNFQSLKACKNLHVLLPMVILRFTAGKPVFPFHL